SPMVRLAGWNGWVPRRWCSVCWPALRWPLRRRLPGSRWRRWRWPAGASPLRGWPCAVWGDRLGDNSALITHQNSGDCAMIVRDTLYIDGKWVRPHGQGRLEVTDSSTGKPWASIPEGDADDAKAAVAAARRAFGDWAGMTPAARGEVLDRVAAEMKSRADELARAIATEVGMPLKMASRVQVAGPVAAWSAYAKMARDFEFEQRVGNSLVVR